ncbi:MAG: hypothetical protein ABR583_09600 [Gaiellaceae bacterium]
MVRLLPLLGFVALAAGCGGASTYAGMGPYEAANRVQDAMRIELGDRASKLHGHRVEFLGVEQDRTDDGLAAWAGVYRDHTSGGKVCVWVWTAEESILRETLTYYADVCPPRLRNKEAEA